MDQNILNAMAAELAKSIKTEKDLSDLTTQLVKMTVETALSAELDEHLGHERHAPSVSGNTRNGSTRKTLKSHHGEVLIETPRDRDGSFSPRLVKKHQTRLTQMDDQILSPVGWVSEA